MKLKEVKIDQIVVDKYGNEYIVTEVDESKSADDVITVKSLKPKGKLK